MKGNVALLIWLGKQYLGQRDKADVADTLPETPREHTVIFVQHGAADS